MKITKRYTRTFLGFMERYDRGEWVKYNDAELAIYRAIQTQKDYIDLMESTLDDERAKIAALKKKIELLQQIIFSAIVAVPISAGILLSLNTLKLL